jgi:nucleoside-diphosphate-sugar epimerase
MRVLVIGGTGFIGPDVVRRLSADGHAIALFHRGQTQADLPAHVLHILGDRHQLAASAGELRHFAPDIVLDMFPYNDEDATMVMGTVRGMARRVVAISSQDVYRAYGRLIGIEDGPPEPVPYSEDAPVREQLYPYRGKLAGEENYEKMLAERVVLGDPELPGTVLRLPMVYGPRDQQHRVFEYLKRIDDGRRFILLDASLERWRWTRGYVENVADAIALAIVNERAAGQVYNVGEPQALSLADWIRRIGRAAGWTGKLVLAPRERLPAFLHGTIDGAHDLVADTTRMRTELGYMEQVDLDEALHRTVEWERAHPPATIDTSRFDYAAEDAVLTQMGMGI